MTTRLNVLKLQLGMIGEFTYTTEAQGSTIVVAVRSNGVAIGTIYLEEAYDYEVPTHAVEWIIDGVKKGLQMQKDGILKQSM